MKQIIAIALLALTATGCASTSSSTTEQQMKEVVIVKEHRYDTDLKLSVYRAATFGGRGGYIGDVVYSTNTPYRVKIGNEKICFNSLEGIELEGYNGNDIANVGNCYMVYNSDIEHFEVYTEAEYTAKVEADRAKQEKIDAHYERQSELLYAQACKIKPEFVKTINSMSYRQAMNYATHLYQRAPGISWPLLVNAKFKQGKTINPTCK